MPERRVDFPCDVLGPHGYHAAGAKAPFFFRHLDVPQPESSRVVVDSHPAEEFLDDLVLLPRQKGEGLASELALRVDQEMLEEADGVSRLGFVEVVVVAETKRRGF